MCNGFFGLRHHAIVCGNHQDDNVGTLCPASTHGSESCMARSIQEGDLSAFQFHLISPDMLRYAACLAFSDICMTNRIQKGGLAVVYVSEDGHDWRAWRQSCFVFVSNGLPPKRYFTSLFFLWSLLTFKRDLKTHFVS